MANQFWTGIGNMASDAANSAISAGMGLILGHQQDKRQMNMARKLQRQQMEGDKEMTDYNYNKQLQMWEATGYGAQLDQIKRAGLSPALIYGGQGAGGATTNIETGRTSTAGAPTGGGEIQAMMGLGLQRELLQAQKENIQAQTEKTKAETGNVPKTGAQIEASTMNLLQGIKSAEAQQALTELQTELGQIQKQFDTGTLQDRIKQINLYMQTAEETLEALQRDNEINNSTKESKIAQITANAISAALEPALKRAQITATKQSTQESIARILKIAQEIKESQEQITKSTAERGYIEHQKTLNRNRLNLDRLREYHEEAKARGAYNEIPDLSELLDNILIVPNLLKGKGTNPIRGLHDRK